MMFNDPQASQSVPLDEVNGSLLLFTVYEETEEIQTVHGPSTAIRADIVVLDGNLEGETYDDALIFPKILKSELRKSVGGSMVLGRLGQGDKKPGKNPPWTLSAASDADKAMAQKWVESNGATRDERDADYEEPF